MTYDLSRIISRDPLVQRAGMSKGGAIGGVHSRPSRVDRPKSNYNTTVPSHGMFDLVCWFQDLLSIISIYFYIRLNSFERLLSSRFA